MGNFSTGGGDFPGELINCLKSSEGGIIKKVLSLLLHRGNVLRREIFYEEGEQFSLNFF